MRIVSLNAWGGRLYEDMLAWLREVQPDVLCLQEVIHVEGSPSDWLKYRDDGADLLQRANLLNEVAQALPGHQVIFCPAARGDLWHGDRAVSSLWGLATYVRRDLTVVGQAQGFVHGNFSPDGFGPHPRSRTAHAVRFHDPEEGMFTVAHMHGLRDPMGKMDTPARAEQARKLLSMVQGVTHAGDKVVVCGDFNVAPRATTFRLLAPVAPYELVTTRGFEGTRTSHYTKDEKFADYMLVNGPLRDAAFDVVRDPEISDHCPLMLNTA
ncbi:endonuclease/exonuclease/phosphatase family protein [Pseudooceanicola sp. C21-150M6]|uniref:endonuclease/exonuclease/phosphatase family protein n=1 Tax=Pseudooceanicola sp. C21-150M6 TaxID=3434355 RepID=UPI003D7F806A